MDDNANAPTQAPPSPNLKVVPKSRPRPVQPLPTERVAVRKQLDLLRAYAITHQTAAQPAKYKEVAAIVKMHENTAQLVAPFFEKIGLLEKVGQQGFSPSADILAFQHAYQWNPDTAAAKLAPALAKTWFAVALTPDLTYNGTVSLDAAVYQAG